MAERTEILSDAEVDFLLSEEASDRTQPSQDVPAVTMRGDLEQIQLADIFQTLAMTKMEGVLRVRNPLEERHVHCRDGYLQLHVPQRILARRIGQRLVNAGIITPESLRSALLAQRKDKRPLGILLVAGGHADQETVDAIVADQVAEDMFALFTWRHGTFEMWKGAPAGEMATVFEACPEYEINSLLLEVARRSDEWQSILAAIGSLDEIPVRSDDGAIADMPSPLHAELLAGVDGHASYRELSERTTAGLFEAARAARDLARMAKIANLNEPQMVAVAQRIADSGNTKRALMTLQTLRDRPGDRPVGILQSMANCLQSFGERKLACTLLLEAAQRHPDGESALALARTARKLEPHDVGMLSFLRTVLVAHAPADSAELEQCTLDLLDALIAADKTSVALDIIEDARRTNTVRPAILLREARARQKSRDLTGASTVLEELARLHDERGETQLANDAYDALLRVDRSRRDIEKLLQQRRRTRAARLVHAGVLTSAVAILLAIVFAYWRHYSYQSDLASAQAEVTVHIDAGRIGDAERELDAWSATLGDVDVVLDLRTKIAYARSMAAAKVQRQRRAELATRLAVAADLLQTGQLTSALSIYEELAREPDYRSDAVEAAEARLRALAGDLTSAGKALQVRMPPPPKQLLDRADLLAAQQKLDQIAGKQLLACHAQLPVVLADAAIVALLSAETQQQLASVQAEFGGLLAQAAGLSQEYVQAVAKNDAQRRLDPLFQRAVQRELAHDFAGALEDYRELDRQSQEEGAVRAHFRDRIARNATICQLLDLAAGATKAGDHATALQHLRALRTTYTDVDFDGLVRLPLRVVTRPAGAAVVANGATIGTTPFQLDRAPAQTVAMTFTLPGFTSASRSVHGDGEAEVVVDLLLAAEAAHAHGSAIEVAPLETPRGILAIDRAGAVTLLARNGTALWTRRTDDLSGCLTAATLRGNHAYLGSVDGVLRCIDVQEGNIAWSVDGLPTELPPALIDDGVAVATTDGDLEFVTRRGAQRTRIAGAAAPLGLWSDGNGVVTTVAVDGRIRRFDGAARMVLDAKVAVGAIAAASFDDGRLLLTTDAGIVLSVRRDGEIEWRRDLGVETLGPAIRHGDHAWQTTRTGMVRIALADGAVAASIHAADGEYAGPAVLFGDKLIAPTATGPVAYDAVTAAFCYRLAGSRKTRVLATPSLLSLVDADHTVTFFRAMR